METEAAFEPMDQDGDVDTLQVEVINDNLYGNGSEGEDEVDYDAADDLEITEFTKTVTSAKQEERSSTPMERIMISVVDPEDDSKEDGEISEAHSNSDMSDGEGDRTKPYLSRSSSLKSGRKRNDIRRERSPIAARKYPNPYLEFDDEKIQSRALRFGLSNASAASAEGDDGKPKLTEMDLVTLYHSCGLITDDGGELTTEKVGAQHRLDSILIRGTNHMNTNEIFKYLYDMGQKPVAMEWVNDAMCVVNFKDHIEAAISLMKTSKPIVLDTRSIERKRSIVEGAEGEKEDENKVEDIVEDFDYDKVDVVSQSSITVPMPPGYVWRFGAPCEKAKGILVRFANKNDKKQERAERFSEFYKNYGNPNKAGNSREYSGNDRNDRQRGRKKFRPETFAEPDNKEESPVSELSMLNANDKNGWGQLSAMWDDEEAFQQSARDRLTLVRKTKDDPSQSAGISPLKKPELSKELSPTSVDARTLIQSRKKRKRGSNSSEEDSDSNNGDNDQLNVLDWKDNRSFRRKRNSKVDDEEEDLAWKERLAGPRMRMHADEEEERIKRRAFRRLGHKRGSGEGSFLTNNTREFSRESSRNNSFRYKSNSQQQQQRRPMSERLGAKRNQVEAENNNDDPRFDDEEDFANASGFDLRHKLMNMRRSGFDVDDEDDHELHDLIFEDN